MSAHAPCPSLEDILDFRKDLILSQAMIQDALTMGMLKDWGVGLSAMIKYHKGSVPKKTDDGTTNERYMVMRILDGWVVNATSPGISISWSDVGGGSGNATKWVINSPYGNFEPDDMISNWPQGVYKARTSEAWVNTSDFGLPDISEAAWDESNHPWFHARGILQDAMPDLKSENNLNWNEEWPSDIFTDKAKEIGS